MMYHLQLNYQVLVQVHSLQQVHHSMEEVTEKGEEEEGGLSVGGHSLLQGLVKILREWELHLRQEAAVHLWDVVVE